MSHEERPDEREQDVPRHAADHVHAHRGRLAVRGEPGSDERQARREDQRAERTRHDLIRERGRIGLDHPEVEREQRRAEDADEKDALRPEAVGEVAAGDLAERIGEGRGGGQHSRLREAHVQVFADERQEERDSAQRQHVEALAEHHQRDGERGVAPQRSVHRARFMDAAPRARLRAGPLAGTADFLHSLATASRMISASLSVAGPACSRSANMRYSSA